MGCPHGSEAKRPRGTRLLQIEAIAAGRALPGVRGPLEQLRGRWLSRLDLALRAMKNRKPSQELLTRLPGFRGQNVTRAAQAQRAPGQFGASNSLIHVINLGKPCIHAG
jgi:hypothetical protein